MNGISAREHLRILSLQPPFFLKHEGIRPPFMPVLREVILYTVKPDIVCKTASQK